MGGGWEKAIHQTHIRTHQTPNMDMRTHIKGCQECKPKPTIKAPWAAFIKAEV